MNFLVLLGAVGLILAAMWAVYRIAWRQGAQVAYRKTVSAVLQAQTQGRNTEILTSYHDALVVVTCFIDLVFERMTVADAEKLIANHITAQIEAIDPEREELLDAPQV